MKSTQRTVLVLVLVLLTSVTAHAWKFETVDRTANTGQYTSIAVDGSDKVHISYIDQANGELKYARSTSWGDWAIFTASSAGVVFTGLHTSLALDSLDRAHICYIDWTN